METLNKNALLLIRLSLGIAFLWFGALKLFTTGDGISLLQKSLPTALAFSQLFSFLVAFLEILLGISFLSNKFIRSASIIAFLYLIITSFFIMISVGFDPRFPVLSTAGESTIKNLVLAASALMLISTKSNRIPKENID